MSMPASTATNAPGNAFIFLSAGILLNAIKIPIDTIETTIAPVCAKLKE